MIERPPGTRDFDPAAMANNSPVQDALRPEFTASVIRFYLSELRSLPKPLKLYCLGNAFRYEEPQKGRYREFFQFNAEILGGSSLEADAELLALALAALRHVGLRQTEARVGHIGMLRAFLREAGGRQAAILHALDKKDFERLRAEHAGAGLSRHEETLQTVVGLQGGLDVLDEAARLLGGDAAPAGDYLRRLR